MMVTTQVVLVDTNIVSYRFSKPSKFEPYKEHLAGKFPAISFATYAEAMEGAIEAGWNDRHVAELETHLRGYIIIPADRQLAAEWARVSADCKQRGFPVNDHNDLWIAATAIRHSIPLLTNDQGFRRIRRLLVLPTEEPFGPKKQEPQRRITEE